MSTPRTLRAALGRDVAAPPIPLNFTAQWFADDFPPKASWGTVLKLLAHTTETPSRSRHGSRLLAWPGYDAGANAPNWTGLPDCQQKQLIGRAHFPVASSSRALRNSSEPGETNAVPGGVFQIELVGTCSPEVSRKWQRRGLVPDVDFIEWWRPPDWAMDQLADVWVWLHQGWGVPLCLGSTLWPAYPSSPALDRRARMDRREWERARGLLGHLHVPDGNEHLDPGAFPAADLLRRALAKAGARPAVTPAQEDDVQLNETVPMGPGARSSLGGRDQVGELLVLAAQGGLAALQTQRSLAEVTGEVAAIRTAVAALSAGAGTPITEAQIVAAGKAAGEALADRLASALTDSAGTATAPGVG